ncbi:MAG TPA: RagB/SusD family nutrient uptake outer membrane protein [Chitinophagaceae bacterium]|nr:RagB/SusD family nutrient uptake outer membrane protein [Chitinophagaceae bacterium]
MKKSLFGILQRKLAMIGLAVVAFHATSCKKMLDPDPKDVILDNEFLKNYWDAEFMLRGAYQAMQPIVEYKFIHGELRADWVKPGPGADNDMLELFAHRVTDKNRYTDWKVYYDLVNRANYVIENVPRVPLDANFFSEYEQKMYIGEGRFLRAWAYFQLIMNFDKVPLVLKAVDKITNVPYLPATAQNVILDSIEADLARAYEATSNGIINVPNTFDIGKRPSEETYRLRATKRTVAALQAEVYLWRNKYVEAVAACNNYSNTGGGGPGGVWFNQFWGISNANLFNGEMFFVPFDYLGRQVQPLMTIISNDPLSGGKYMVAPSDTAIRTYNPNWPNSIGTNTAVDEINRGFGRSYAGGAPYYNRLNSSPVIWKYLGTGTVTPSNANVTPNVRKPYQSDARFHIYRFADVQLLWAEALNRAGDKANAIARINSVRSASGTGMPNATVTTASSTEQIEDYILRERGLELGFEGDRWYDLMRIAKRRNSPQYLIDRVMKRAPVSQHPYLQTWLSDVKNWYLPYNAEEKRLNPNL